MNCLRLELRHISGLLATTMIAGTAFLPGVALAQEHEEEPAGEIVVTALKRDSKLQDTPISIAALPAEELQKLGATNFSDYYRSVPGLQVTENAAGQNRISIRGIYAPGEPTVGVYYDETPLNGPSGTTSDPGLQTPNINLFDVERVEVLRGPQGTLYGSSSVGGTLRVIFKKPDSTQFEGAAEAQISTTEDGTAGYFIKGALNTPILQDLLAARVVGYYQRNPGWVDNIRTGINNVNDGDSYGGRLMVRATPTAEVSLSLMALYQNNEFNDNASWYQQFGRQSYNSDQPLRQRVKDELQLYNGTLNWDLSFANLTATSSYYKWEVTRTVDPTPSLSAVIPGVAPASAGCRNYFGLGTSPCSATQVTAYKNFLLGTFPAAFYAPLYLKTQTHELRLSSPGGGFVDWTVGAYYESRKDHIQSIVAKGDAATGELLDPLVINGNRFVADEVKQFAQFGEVSVRPVDGLTLTGGARHYHYEKTVSGQVLQTGYIISSFPGALTQAKSEADGWVGKANISYQFTRDILAYAQWGQGFRPGGANNIPNLPAESVSYQPDKLNNYEIGVKTSFDRGRHTLNFDVYQIDWSDIQGTLTIATGFRAVTNAGTARIRGVEVEGTTRPFPGFTLQAGLSYIPTAELVAGQNRPGITPNAQTGLVGDRMPYTPKFAGNVSAEYEAEVASDLKAFGRVDVRYRGKSQNEFRSTYAFFETLDEFTETNLRFGVEADNWTASLFATNLFNVVGPLSVQSAAAAAPYQYERQLISLRPRTLGLNVSSQF